ncbi:protein-disulfide reductase DsbD family protein [Tenacibaculum holothuriorum]|uniref:protein-disulfide reductase DsbD family protein n=1 Tax=Tenacibaculum holothuriorum TaxID=1635173 RepID=UPI000A32AC60|nr:thioredoxin family protein [Tenacibaculum holothuriorum]
MKRLLLLLILVTNVVSAQILDPVKWSFKTEAISDNEFNLIFTAKLDQGWAIYSQHLDDGGPVPTEFFFDKNDAVELIGEVAESDFNKSVAKDPLFNNMTVTKFYKVATFTQKVRVKDLKAKFTGSVNFMTCDSQRCIPPNDENFEFSFDNSKSSTTSNNETTTTALNDTDANELLYGMTANELVKTETNCANQVVSKATEVKKQGKSLWNIFALGFAGGLLALLTPCVFPMIPLTVSFFTKKGEKNKGSGISKALLYGFFILAVYLVLSIPFHLLDSVNPDILNEISTNVWLNIIFFVIFVFFAFSFFGYYELTLPASWTSKTTQGESVGGILGIFFMALTLAIVSFSCTGPILGSLLAGSLTADGGAWQLTAGMGGFGVALGLPFALFAMFPNMLNSLPKSGGWLNSVKVVLGFLELALAFKFLSNADLVQHWNLLKIEPFLIIWILIFAGLTLYLFGKIKFPHDSPLKKLSFFRISFGILVAAFTIYLASGFRINQETKTFTPLTLLSGLAPPVGYSFIYPKECPNNLECFKDLKTGIAYAQKVNKPILLDFTGYACVNCRKMEEHVWPLPKIDDYIRNNYVLISLYVDDKKELPENEKVFVNRINGGQRKLETYGNKWAHYQTQFFQTNSQPFYALLSSDGKKVLNQPVGYTPAEDDYASFLQCGLDAFKELQNSVPSIERIAIPTLDSEDTKNLIE